MRQVSTLQADPKFKMSRQEAAANFMGFYRNKHTSRDMRMNDFIWQTWLMLIFPGISGMKLKYNTVDKSFKEDVASDKRMAVHPKSVLYRLNAEQRFVLKACVGSYSVNSLSSAVLELFSVYRLNNPGFTDEFRETLTDGQNLRDYLTKHDFNSVFTGEQLASRLPVNQAAREILRTAIESARLEEISGRLALTLRFNISFKEAEYLCQTPAQSIKNGMFYSFLMRWIATNLGSDTNASVAPYSIAMSKIAGQVKAAMEDPNVTVTKQAGSDNLVVDHLAMPLYIPEVDNTKNYEDELTAFGQRSDGSFSYDQGIEAQDGEDEGNAGRAFRIGEARKKLPANKFLLTDWVNRKFAYVNSLGNVDFIDLSQCVPLKPTHVRILLEQSVLVGAKDSSIGRALYMAEQTRPGMLAGAPFNKYFTNNEARLVENIKKDITKPEFLGLLVDKVYRWNSANRITNHEAITTGGAGIKAPTWLFGPNSPVAYFRFIGDLCKEAETVLAENLEVILSKYSVQTVLGALATLMIFNRNVDKYADVVKQDLQERDVYINQGIDPNHVMTALPNFKKDAAFMPHQAKVENKTRMGPPFAIIEVDAGGGKTLSIIASILREMKSGKAKRPLIACPGHLVSSYIHEAVYFTEGKVNVVPLTNVSLKQHGEERLTQLILNAPTNTIFLTDFDFIRNKSSEVAYGNKMLTIYRNAEFLRKFSFDLICIDECHYLRNSASLRTKAAQALILEIPMKRLASGTFIADTVVDVAPQFALLDPTIFGTKDQFINAYAAEVKGNKVIAWKPNARTLIREKMADHCVMVNHKRKEWAALLPFPQEEFFAVELTANQRALYEAILKKTIETLQEAIAKDPELREALESNDDTKVEELMLKLRRYLARLEAFLSCPETDEAGKDFLLLPEDRVSPKVKMIYERIRVHTEQQIPGKILIFTNYVRAAESVYENAPPDIKKRMILYTADKKMECKALFETDDRKDIMVGVENSMNVGLNFQFVSRLIRMETVWTPGVLEQGNARVNRPNKKKAETRNNIWFDWIIIQRTIDITKISRLISKIVSKVMFDEYDNPAYQMLTAPKQIPMTIDTIQTLNDFETGLLPYLETYEKLKQIQMKDFADYRAANPELKDVGIPSEGVLPGSKLMSRIPYVPDMQIYGADQLGLVRYDQFVKQDQPIDDDDDDEDDEGDDENEDALDPRHAQLQEERAVMKHQAVHTEWGDGIITAIGKKRVRVLLPNGERRPINKLSVFVITRSESNTIDMRSELLKQIGEIPLTEPITVPSQPGAANKKRAAKGAEVEVEEPQETKAEFDITVVNDYLALAYRSKGHGDPMIDRLSNVGFVKSPDYYYSKVLGPKNMIKLFRDWKDDGFKMDPKVSSTFQHIFQALKGDTKAANRYGFATEIDLKNWVRLTIKPSSDPKEIKPYPIVQDEVFFIALPIAGQAGTRNAIKHQPNAIRWKLGGGENEVLRFVTKAAEIPQVLKQVKDAGIPIGNLDELKSQYDDYKMVKPRN